MGARNQIRWLPDASADRRARHPAFDTDRPRLDRALCRDRHSVEDSWSELGAARRRNRGRGFRGPAKLSPAAGRFENRKERSPPILSVRPALLRRLRSDASEAVGPQGLAAKDCRQIAAHVRHSLQRAPRPGRAHDVRTCVPAWSGGDRIEAHRSALPAWAGRPLAQGEGRAPAGVHHSGLHPLDRRERDGGGPAARLLRPGNAHVCRTRRHRLFRRSGQMVSQRARQDCVSKTHTGKHSARGFRKERALGEAPARRRNRISRLDHGQAHSTILVQGAPGRPSAGGHRP